MNRIRRHGILAVGLAATAALLLPGAPAAADHETACTTGAGLDLGHASGAATYSAVEHVTTEGKKKRAVTTSTWTDGTFTGNARPDLPLCAGYRMVFSVDSVAGAGELGWTTTSTTGGIPEPALGSLLGAAPDGRHAEVVLVGNGVSNVFEVTGTTADSYGQQCVAARLTITDPTGVTTYQSVSGEACASGGSGGTSYFG